MLEFASDPEAPRRAELTLVGANGAPVRFDIGFRVTSDEAGGAMIQAIGRDITDRKAAEEHHCQSQKMEAMVLLAGGVAHDFNNLLTGILGYSSLLAEQSGDQPEIREAAEVIQRAAERAAQLTNQLLGFARRGDHQRVPVDVHASILEVVELLQRTVAHNVEMIPDFQATTAWVLGDPGQMHQVFLNLALNASDAMPNGGTLRFRTEAVECKATRQTPWPLPPGQYLKVSVADTGVGIPPDIQARIFEPFFTTKAEGRGTGLGLATVYGIVKNHGGHIEVSSELGKGTTFAIYLPLSKHSEPRVESKPREKHGASGSILVVDDEEMVRLVLSNMLQHLGYKVTTAAGGREAIRYYREHWQETDLVILDMKMPGMSGRECLLQLREINPSVNLILSSGYGREGVMQEVKELGVTRFIQKPYRHSTLAEAVAEALAVKP